MNQKTRRILSLTLALLMMLCVMTASAKSDDEMHKEMATNRTQEPQGIVSETSPTEEPQGKDIQGVRPGIDRPEDSSAPPIKDATATPTPGPHETVGPIENKRTPIPENPLQSARPTKPGQTSWPETSATPTPTAQPAQHHLSTGNGGTCWCGKVDNSKNNRSHTNPAESCWCQNYIHRWEFDVSDQTAMPQHHNTTGHDPWKCWCRPDATTPHPTQETAHTEPAETCWCRRYD